MEGGIIDPSNSYKPAKAKKKMRMKEDDKEGLNEEKTQSMDINGTLDSRSWIEIILGYTNGTANGVDKDDT